MSVTVMEARLCGVKFENTDFSGQDLKHANLTHSIFHNCNFDLADLTDANCSESDFTGCTFRESKLTRSNFMKSRMANTVFEPKDCYGIVFSLECSTFENMRIGRLWWFAWLMFACQMVPKLPVEEGNLRDQLIGGVIGAERFAKLRDMFRRRVF